MCVFSEDWVFPVLGRQCPVEIEANLMNRELGISGMWKRIGLTIHVRTLLFHSLTVRSSSEAGLSGMA